MTDSRIEPIRAIESATLSDRIRRNKGRMIHVWKARVRQETGTARQISEPLLADSLPVFLDRLADAFDPTSSRSLQSVPRIGDRHGAQRATLDFSLDEILREYIVLRQVLFEIVEEESPISKQERDCLLDTLQSATRNAVNGFVRAERLERESRIRVRSLKPVWKRSLATLGLVAGATAIQLLIWPWTAMAPFALYFGTMPLVALFGYVIPAILLSAWVAEYLFVGAFGSIELVWPDSLVRFFVFLLGSFLISWTTRSLQHARATAKEAIHNQSLARKEAEESERRFRMLTEQVKDYAILMLDPDGRVMTWSDGAGRILGYDTDEVIGRHIEMFSLPEDREAGLARAILENAIKNGQYEEVRRKVKNDGGVFIADVLVTPLYDDSGALIGFSNVIQDVTDRKTTERQLERLLRLEKLERGRAEAINEELMRERELREQFVSTLTHDLRNPLTAAQVSAQLIIRSPGEPLTVSRIAERISRSVERADKMIQDLLDTHLIRVGKSLPLNVEACDLGELTRITLDELSMVHGDRFRLQMAEDSIHGYWSASGLKRIIENLAVNAVKYGDPSAPVTVSLKSNPERDTVCMEVHNEGPSIPEEEQAVMFEVYRRSAGSHAQLQKGWGLGLTLVRGIAESHGGSVRVESNQERGTIFGVELPIDCRPAQ